ncbi:hypothetical protein CW362_37990 [Streptomyces populi]|uniref:Uncharacterized protein n=1 Tax=Streptomyces populi TaxID=2058924 RepID=A0A2I0SD95_9ACTN|nr:hypothetical protein CW362_37990 [Streptomyces populi]
MIPRPHRSSEPTATEASAWADALVRRRLLHAERPVARPGPPDGPVRLLLGPADVLALTAAIQHHTCSTRPGS